jgi:2-oxoglutarate ferredoxin oxidoreductase subunit alpha
MPHTVSKKELLTGSEVVVRAALAAGADFFAGYPITPITEILAEWSREAAKNPKLTFMQMEDETSAGMAVIGGCLAGRKAWTVTGGVGHVLMQDPLVLAETLQMPFVAYIGQRGGPSTGTVIYSQQELTLARFGGNGEGLRIVYAPANTQELFFLIQKAFQVAWRYHFPVLVLGDGYLSKTLTPVDTTEVLPQKEIKPYFLNGEVKNMRNCFSREDELGDHLSFLFKRYAVASAEVVESESYRTSDAEVVVFAWGTVGYAAKVAVANLRKEGMKAGLFRPITMRPFDAEKAILAVKHAKKILVAESNGGHFGRIVRETLAQATNAEFHRLYKPAEGITPEEIEERVHEAFIKSNQQKQ